MGNRYQKYIAVCIAASLLCACVSVVEKTGRVLDGSAFAEKRIARYRASDMEITLVQNKKNERSVIIALNDYPMMKIRGSEPDENGEFYLMSLEYLAGSVNGWNEYTLDILGEGYLFLDEDPALKIKKDIEQIQISAGRIHRFDTRITGGEALTGLRNRRERIAATVEWMYSTDNAPKGQKIDDFEKYWKPVLFPEMVLKKKRPAGWLQEGDVFIRSEDIRWNTGYTERVFSEELRPVRNSGTLLRDWEEALSWIYLEYEWESIKERLSRLNILQFIK
ncbi:MAG: hypothetical protein LBQ82_03545 [Treponema sp.]|jgi:hypothetical protein|nr:hypothetical protein [Treponema sp.]